MKGSEDFLERIVSCPDDTSIRLVYADWLLERGDARGEMIRLQCEAAEAPLPEARAKRLRGLLRTHAKKWLGPLGVVTDVRSRVWDRGFLAGAHIEAGHFQEMQSAVGYPVWRTVRFLDVATHPYALDLVAHPVMQSLRCVTRLLASHFRQLGKSQFANKRLPIEELDLLEWRTGGEEALTDLDACPALPNLRVLAMGERSPEQIPWLFTSPLAAQLRCFAMRYNVAALAPWQKALGEAKRVPFAELGFGVIALPDEARLAFQLTLTRANSGDWSRVVLRRPPAGLHEGLRTELTTLRVTELELIGFDEKEASALQKACALERA